MKFRAVPLLLTVGSAAFGDVIYPVEGVAQYRIDIRTGVYERISQSPGPRFGPDIAWDRDSPWMGFIGTDPDGIHREFLDWADAGDAGEVLLVNGFRFSYCTNSTDPVALVIAFYVNENGYPSDISMAPAIFQFTNLPGRHPIEPINCYQFDVDLPDPEFDQFELSGTDLDSDGLSDFGYSLTISSCGTCDGQAGPLIADGPISTSPGSTPQHDIYYPPKHSSGEHIRTDGPPAGTLGQFAMRIYVADGDGCPQPGCDDGGIDADFDTNCIINLGDLAQMLAGYGIASGAAPDQGDTDSDGDVDLNDLTNLLGRFGNDCQ